MSYPIISSPIQPTTPDSLLKFLGKIKTDGSLAPVSDDDPLQVAFSGTPSLPTGAATAAMQDTQITAEQAILAKLTSDPATQTTLAALLAKLAAFGTAGTPSANVLSVQGIAGGTALPGTDAGPAWTTGLGLAGARFTSADQSAAVADITSAPTSGQKLLITDILYSSDTALRLDFSEETTGTILASVYTTAGGSGQVTTRSKIKLATANKKLQVRASAAGNIAITPLYYSEA